jgi:hypothetical protein
MSWIRVETEHGRTGFAPGEEVAGTAAWSLAEVPSTLELRLFWYTAGKGTRDLGVVERLPCDLVREGRREFRFRLPVGPHSVSGKLVSVLWAIELVAEPSGDAARAEITIGPGGREVRLGSAGAGESGPDGAGAG